jgi:hypothetical protein
MGRGIEESYRGPPCLVQHVSAAEGIELGIVCESAYWYLNMLGINEDIEYQAAIEFYIAIQMDSDSESDSSSEYNLQNLFGSSEDEESIELLSKPSSWTSTPCPKHNIGTRIQAVTFLELGIPHLEITRKTGVSKAQLYKLQDKALSRG